MRALNRSLILGLICSTAFACRAGEPARQVLQTNRLPAPSISEPTREMKVEKRYLNLPVKNGAPRRRVSFLVDGKVAREFDIELADGEPDFWVFLDLAPFQGKPAVIKVDSLPESSGALKAIEQADQIKGAKNLYHETLRPQFHFSTRRGWNNDPNGLVFYKGEYHLFYQYNPYGWNWGNMHWGHAVSPDLVHWTELPIAIYPYRYGDWAFSGSAAVDWKNTGGFKTGKDDVLVAAYTSTGRGECIVFSNDRGRTFSEYSGNPVVKHLGRDPRLFWHHPTGQWVMAVYDELPGEPDEEKQRGIAFHTSPDLKHWTLQSRIAGFFECPDIFELPVDGNKEDTRWVLTAASSEYMIGRFDGKTFMPETPKLPGHRGSKFYAAQTFSDIPARDGRRIQIGWSQNATPDMPFNQMMAFPCELTLRATPEGIRMFWQPVREIAGLYRRVFHWKDTALGPDTNLTVNSQSELLDIQTTFEPRQAESVSVLVRGVPITYDAVGRRISCGGNTNSLPLLDGKISLRILADRTSLEIYGNDGALYMPMGFAPRDKASVTLSANGGPARINALEVHELKSAWK
jgi:fructan beta-fructosidase